MSNPGGIQRVFEAFGHAPNLVGVDLSSDGDYTVLIFYDSWTENPNKQLMQIRIPNARTKSNELVQRT